ncbi:MAG: sensor histidine kinase [Verrucomicrobiota bacterium]|nr:sensor histidine kinase [Verrucomicrobiota bacterium]
MFVLLIGYGDFRQGNENSMLLFYMIPIALATWYSGTAAGIGVVALSVAAAVLADKLAGIPSVELWNVGMSVAYYLVFVGLLSRWHNSVKHMHAKVEERTADLQREISARKGLEREVANVTEHERARLGRELHDSLCQHLTGTALKAQTVVKQVERGEDCAAATASDVVTLVDRGIEIARDIARGLFSSELEGEGLVMAIGGLAENTSRLHGIDCSFDHNSEISLSPEKATQLYWITREAVTNAVRHARASRIQIRLTQAGAHAELDVEDDGCGLAPYREKGHGIGLHVMRQRAELAGGSLRTSNGKEGGTKVRCLVPVDLLDGTRESED